MKLSFFILLVVTVLATGVDVVCAQKNSKVFEVTVTNLVENQPFSPFFVMVHNGRAEPLFKVGKPAIPELGVLAETGNPKPLVQYYRRTKPRGVKRTNAVSNGQDPPLLFEGESLTFKVITNKRFPFVSIASMAVNTNDCFSGFSKVRLEDGLRLRLRGYDSGTEENNESCDSVPGPACGGTETSGNGEGTVQRHKGIKGVGDLSKEEYDWSGRMLLVEVKQIK